jgi:hypothetical protein
VAHPDTRDSSTTSNKPPSPFVQKRSLQNELNNSDEDDQDIQTIASNSGFAPFSFAQVAATMRGNSRSRHSSSYDVSNDGESASAGIDAAPLSSLGGFRCALKASKKKTKKWSPLDLADLGDPDDLGDVGGSEGEVTDAATIPNSVAPAISASDQGPQFSTSPTDFRHFELSNNDLSSEQSNISKERRASFFNSCDTPTGTAFNAAFPRLQVRPTPTKAPTERSIIHKEDPEDTKQRLEAIMARIDDVFDVEEWDPNLQTGASSNSPEPLTVEPQKVTYTTVGSVAKTNAVPKFTPPVRIQRESGGRRVSIPPTPNRGQDSYYGRNQPHQGPSHALPMHPHQPPQYASKQPAPPSTFDMDELEKFNLTDLEKTILLETLGSTAAAVRSGNIRTSPQKLQGSIPGKSTKDSSDQFSIKRMLKEDAVGPSALLPGCSTLAGLNKMQTLQRLAQFDNPAQAFAKVRLAEFKAVKRQQQESENVALRGQGAGRVPNLDQNNKSGMFQFGSGTHSYEGNQGQGAQYSSPEYGNPLQGAQGFSRHYPEDHYAQRGTNAPPGYPQPLTAGPPGQRQNFIAANRLAWNSAHSKTGDSFQHMFPPNMDGNHYPVSVGVGDFSQPASHMFSSVITDDNYVRETLSVAEMTKYFPTGVPPGFNSHGQYRVLDDYTKQSNLGLTNPYSRTEAQSKKEKLDRWFYGGVERLSMTINDHIEELENRDNGLLPPIQRPNFADRKTFSVKEVSDKTEAECAEALIGGLFGTLVAYSDNVMQPTNRRILSKFVPSPAWALDTSEEGKKSIFGDNWVAPPKRLGRDPRYQSSSGNEVWGSDGFYGKC